MLFFAINLKESVTLPYKLHKVETNFQLAKQDHLSQSLIKALKQYNEKELKKRTFYKINNTPIHAINADPAFILGKFAAANK